MAVYFVTTEQFPLHLIIVLLRHFRHFVAAAATVYRGPHFWTRLRTEGQTLLAFVFAQNIIFVNKFIATYYLI